MSNRLDLDDIRARAGAATEGPWHRVGKSIQADVPLSDDGPSTTKWNTTVVCSVGAWGSGRPTEEDAEFIAHARTDVPALLDFAESLRDQNGYFRDERDLLIARARKIRDVHREAAYTRPGTCADCGQRYPCPTVQILDQPLEDTRA